MKIEVTHDKSRTINSTAELGNIRKNQTRTRVDINDVQLKGSLKTMDIHDLIGEGRTRKTDSG